MPTATTLGNINLRDNKLLKTYSEPFVSQSLTDRILSDQIKKISWILDSLTEYLEITACLPLLLRHEGKGLLLFFNEEETNYIKEVCQKPYIKSHSSILLKSSFNFQTEELEKIDLLKKCHYKVRKCKVEGLKIDPHMSQVVYLLCKHPCLKQEKEQLYPHVPRKAKELIEYIRKVRRAAETMFSVGAKEENEKIHFLAKALRESSMLVEQHKALKRKIKEQTRGVKEDLYRKRKTMERLKDYRRYLFIKMKADAEKRMEEFEDIMIDQQREGFERRAELEEEAEYVCNVYENTLKAHKKSEKRLKEKCNRLEKILINWIEAYDKDVGKKTMEYEKYKDLYDEKMKEYTALQEQFNEQLVMYKKCYGEYEAEERERLEKEAYMFLINNSATKIQRFYRAYKQKKKDKAMQKKRAALAKRMKKQQSKEAPTAKKETGNGNGKPSKAGGKSKDAGNKKGIRKNSDG